MATSLKSLGGKSHARYFTEHPTFFTSSNWEDFKRHVFRVRQLCLSGTPTPFTLLCTYCIFFFHCMPAYHLQRLRTHVLVCHTSCRSCIAGGVPLGVKQQILLGKIFTGAGGTCHHIPGLVMLSNSGQKCSCIAGLPGVALHQQEVMLACHICACMPDLALL